MKYISAVEKEKADVSTPLKAQVDKKVDSLIQQLEARRKELHKEIDDACTKDLKELWAQKEYHETAITSMEGALSFARRALACKEDTELLALCAQVTSRLKELSQLKWDIQKTEKIEVSSVKWTAVSSVKWTPETPETPDKVDVGNVGILYYMPTIKIEPIKMPSTLRAKITFKVLVAFAGTPKNFQSREHHNLKLSGSASCKGSRDVYNQYELQYIPENFTEKVAVKVTESQNEWTINLSAPKGTTKATVTLTASAQYGQRPISTRQSFNL